MHRAGTKRRREEPTAKSSTISPSSKRASGARGGLEKDGSGSLRFHGSAMLRHRIIFSILSRRPIRIDSIRDMDEDPGLKDYEGAFLQMVEQLSKGCKVSINDAGTDLRFTPGVLEGGSIKQICPPSRGVTYLIEGLLLLAPFAKHPIDAVLKGVTNGPVDPSVDHMRTVVFPQLSSVGLEGLMLKIKRRGAAPLGGGEVVLHLPNVRELKPMNMTIEGFVKKVRGVAFATKVTPQVANRAISSARRLLNELLPDVYIASDHYAGKEAGKSPGFAVHLIAETTAGCLIAAEKVAAPQQDPESLGEQATRALLDAIRHGGCVGPDVVPILAPLMALGPADVSRLRIGSLSPTAVHTLRLLRDFFGVEFRIKTEPAGSVRSAALTGAAAVADALQKAKAAKKEPAASKGDDELEAVPNDGIEIAQGPTILLSCVGLGYRNLAKKVT